MTEKNKKQDSRLPNMQWEAFSTARAEQILESANIENRRMRMWWANAIAQMIRRGEYVASPQPISFDDSGVLIDGQHRLKGIALSGKTLPLLVAYNVSHNARLFIDTGMRRTTEDCTGLDKKTSEVARRAVTTLYGGVEARNSNTVLRIAQSGIEDVSKALNSYSSRSTKIFCSSPMRLAAITLVMDGHDQNRVFERYDIFARQEYGLMTKRMVSFNQQTIGGKFNPNSLLARAMSILSPRKKDDCRFRLNDESKYINLFKAIMIAAIENKALSVTEDLNDDD